MNCCIRGAVTVEENSSECIWENTKLMLNEIINANNINIEDIVSIFFTCTRDLDTAYPAVAAREIGIVDAALMCVQELYVKGSLKMCIRAAVNIETNKRQKDMQHVYLKGAKKLRPDIINKNKIDAVAIDGPAGSGKSTVAKLISKELGYIYVDTGAMYRTVGLYCLNKGISLYDNEKIKEALPDVDISLEFENGIQKIYLNGEDVTDKIRTQPVAEAASMVAAIPEVRLQLVEMQRKIAEKNNVVMDGRDIGTNVLKNAKTKIYLDADVCERAKRRCSELTEKCISFDYDNVVKEIIERDNYDKNREVNPLAVAKDAVVIDTTGLTIEQVKNKIMSIVKD